MRLYKVCAWTDNQDFISDSDSQMVAKQMFVVVKGNSFDDIIPKIVEQIRKEFMVNNVDFKFDKIPRDQNELWDVMYDDNKNRFRIYIKDITDEDCRIICVKPIR